MRTGTVYQRHQPKCPRGEDGKYLPHRCRGTWAYMVELGRDATGRRRQTTKAGFATKAQAKAALDAAMRLHDADVAGHDVTVGEYLDQWLEGLHHLAPTTYAQYQDFCRLYLKPRLGSLPLLDLRPHHIDRFHRGLTVGISGKTLSVGTRRRIHACLRSALGAAVKRRVLLYNPATVVELPADDPQRFTPWTLPQVQTFLRVHAEDRLIAAYRLVITTGMRRGELAGLRWENVDLDAARLLVVKQRTGGRPDARVPRPPKSKKSRRAIPIDTTTIALLRAHKAQQEAERTEWAEAWQDTGYVFTREDGTPIPPEALAVHFKKLTADADLPVIRFHDLRHTSATLANDAGVTLKTESERLGHASTAITAEIYTFVSDPTARAAAQLIGDLIDKPAEGEC